MVYLIPVQFDLQPHATPIKPGPLAYIEADPTPGYYRALDQLTDRQVREFCEWAWLQNRRRNYTTLQLWAAEFNVLLTTPPGRA